MFIFCFFLIWEAGGDFRANTKPDEVSQAILFSLTVRFHLSDVMSSLINCSKQKWSKYVKFLKELFGITNGGCAKGKFCQGSTNCWHVGTACRESGGRERKWEEMERECVPHQLNTTQFC